MKVFINILEYKGLWFLTPSLFGQERGKNPPPAHFLFCVSLTLWFQHSGHLSKDGHIFQGESYSSHDPLPIPVTVVV